MQKCELQYNNCTFKNGKKKKKIVTFSFFIRNIKKESQIKLKNTKIAFENCILLLEKKNIWNASNQ